MVLPVELFIGNLKMVFICLTCIKNLGIASFFFRFGIQQEKVNGFISFDFHRELGNDVTYLILIGESNTNAPHLSLRDRKRERQQFV
jgi:hypothetical protein